MQLASLQPEFPQALIDVLIGLTDPSPNRALTTPGWADPNPNSAVLPVAASCTHQPSPAAVRSELWAQPGSSHQSHWPPPSGWENLALTDFSMTAIVLDSPSDTDAGLTGPY